MELKPCPFCGSLNNTLTELYVDEKSIGYYEYVVECSDCLSGGPIKHSEKGAIDAWNKRS